MVYLCAFYVNSGLSTTLTVYHQILEKWTKCGIMASVSCERAETKTSDQLVEQLACRISRWGLAQPAILFLEVTKPLNFIASQGLLLCEPLLSFFYREPRVADYANLLADRSNMEDLIVRLERDRPTCNSIDEEGD
jgi:hypothetical protein